VSSWRPKLPISIYLGARTSLYLLSETVHCILYCRSLVLLFCLDARLLTNARSWGGSCRCSIVFPFFSFLLFLIVAPLAIFHLVARCLWLRAMGLGLPTSGLE